VSSDAAPAILIAAAAIVSAALGFRAAMLASDASGDWESAVRVEVREGAGAVNDAILVFGEAPFAARVATTQFRAEELESELATADPSATRNLLIESTLLAAVAQATGGKADTGEALAVDRRLAERRRSRTVAGEPSARQLEEDGDSTGLRAALTAAAAVPAGLAFLLGAIAQAFPRRRRAFVVVGVAALAAAAVAGVAVEVATT
jgi:hypothetical protein